MGLLDYADAARKKLAGLLGDMPLVKMARGQAEMPTMGGLLASLKSMPVFSPDAGQSAYEAALNIGPMGLGKIVYHGSPHKFDKFDASKIGTGEGAQAYGHGVYLADAQGVADGYRTALSPKKITLDPSLIKEELANLGFDPKSINMAKTELQNYGGDVGGTLELLDGLHMNTGYQRAKDAAAVIRAMSPSHKVEQGALYKADLPDEWIPKMLDWDKPLSGQKEILSRFSDEVLDNLGVTRGGMDAYTGKPLAGGDLVRFVENQKGKGALANYGIPGIRYLDGGSRPKNVSDQRLLDLYNAHGGDKVKAVDEFMRSVYETPKEKAKMREYFLKQLENPPSYNYVVFPGLEDQVKILERNGVPLGLLGGN